MGRLRIELLTTPWCPHAEATEATVRAVLADEGVEAAVMRIVIDDVDGATSLGFAGSPTLRVDGRDVLPQAIDAGVGLACRTYPLPDGSFVGEVPPAIVRDALTEALIARERPGVLRRIGELPGRAMRAGFVWASHRRSVERLVRGMPLSRDLVRRFIAGDDLAAALGNLERVRAGGMGTTVDVLGEAVSDERSAAAAVDAYVELLEALAARALDRNVSLKLTQMGLGVDRALCRRNLRQISARAAELGAFVRVDMEDSSRTQVTLDLAREMFVETGNVGVAVQAYLRRSMADVEALDRLGMRVRLCKGAYDEPARVAFRSKREVDESFTLLAERLLAEGTYPALATHDERAIDGCLDFCARHGIEPSRYEFQMLYGVRRDLQERLVRHGQTLRVYVPFGTQWYPYFMRRLAERPANLLFLLRSLTREAR